MTRGERLEAAATRILAHLTAQDAGATESGENLAEVACGPLLDEIERLEDELVGAEGHRACIAAKRAEKAEAERDALAERLAGAEKVIARGVIAFRHTREYVGEQALPALPGWSWFDWCKEAGYDPTLPEERPTLLVDDVPTASPDAPEPGVTA